jgi:hypothetical protein
LARLPRRSGGYGALAMASGDPSVMGFAVALPSGGFGAGAANPVSYCRESFLRLG